MPHGPREKDRGQGLKDGREKKKMYAYQVVTDHPRRGIPVVGLRVGDVPGYSD